MKKVAVVSTSRADFAHLYWPLVSMLKIPELDVHAIVTCAHLSPEFGDTGKLIHDLDMPITQIESLLSSDTDVGMAKTIGVAMLGLADALDRLRPDILLLIADRYEMLAPASTALALRIPIAHIEGGEISEGAIDDAVRNALTKISHLHFTPTEDARNRVIAMGEESWRVHCTGAPSIDYLRRSRLLEKDALEFRLGHALSGPVHVIAYHPLTLSQDTLIEADEFFSALDKLNGRIVFCFPNADAGSRAIIERATRFCHEHECADLHENLPALEYWSLLSHADVMLGNSSSGIMESPSLGLPCVNIGDRQFGRQRAINIIDTAADSANIVDAVARAMSPGFRKTLNGMVSPYGDGTAGDRIADLLVAAPRPEILLRKRARPLARTGGPDTQPYFGTLDED